MPKSNLAKTASARKYFLLLLGCGLVGAGVLWLLQPHQPTISFGSTVFAAEYVDTPASLTKGLSGRTQLDDKRAMVFIFGESGQHCIWMKDMRFDLDILWLNEQKEIVHIKQGATPSSYPNEFCPEHAARYVVEVPAGTTQTYDIRLGGQADF